MGDKAKTFLQIDGPESKRPSPRNNISLMWFLKEVFHVPYINNIKKWK